MVHYGQTTQLQEKHHTQESSQMPLERERERRVKERESLHSALKRMLEDGQKHIVHGFKKKAYGCYEKEMCF